MQKVYLPQNKEKSKTNTFTSHVHLWILENVFSCVIIKSWVRWRYKFI